jgi:hypothetical protein
MDVQEVEAILSADRLGWVAVVSRPDGLFCLYEWWHWDLETQKRMRVEPIAERVWSFEFDQAIYQHKEPLDGIYGTVEDARREGRRLLGLDVS